MKLRNEGTDNPLTDYDGTKYKLRPKIKKLIIILFFTVIFVISISEYITSQSTKIEVQSISGQRIKTVPVSVQSMDNKTVGFIVINRSPFNVKLIVSVDDYDAEIKYESVTLYQNIKTYVVITVYNPTVDDKELKLLVEGEKI